MDTRPIGVFDSGLGGLTAVKELERVLPDEDIVYFGDTGRVPYGTKSRETIKKFAVQDVRFLQSHDVKAIIIACGTVSSVALEECRQTFQLPVIGVVEPAVNAAVAATKNGRIGVLGTSATIRSGMYEKAISALLPQATVKSRACPLFVPLVENGYFARGNQVTELVVREYLSAFEGTGIDTLILGCTHYPLLRGVIADALPGVTLIDAGCETAKAAAALLEEKSMLRHDGGEARYFVSDSTEDFERLAGIFLEHPVKGLVQKVEIENF